MHAGDTFDARVEEAGDVGGRVRVVGRIARRRRLVELDPLAARCRELADLVVERWHERLGEVGPVRVVVDGADEGRQGERTGQRDLDRRGSACRGVGELLDCTHPIRHANRTDGLLDVAHVERHRAHLARCPTIAETGHARCESPHEAGPTHLAVADHVEAGLLLVENRPVDGVVERLFDVDRPEATGLHQLFGAIEPRRMGVAADHGCRQDGETMRHVVERSRRVLDRAIAVLRSSTISTTRDEPCGRLRECIRSLAEPSLQPARRS